VSLPLLRGWNRGVCLEARLPLRGEQEGDLDGTQISLVGDRSTSCALGLDRLRSEVSAGVSQLLGAPAARLAGVVEEEVMGEESVVVPFVKKIEETIACPEEADRRGNIPRGGQFAAVVQRPDDLGRRERHRRVGSVVQRHDADFRIESPATASGVGAGLVPRDPGRRRDQGMNRATLWPALPYVAQWIEQRFPTPTVDSRPGGRRAPRRVVKIGNNFVPILYPSEVIHHDRACSRMGQRSQSDLS
jgi:hypothetical protein